ncbi:HesA/MoeB/ThiF family protein [Larkinella bovis]|uniref:HesA/MoeB/ThiF family protein n=1 Tax=Larkinella bovis TaxID=683041 RepID=A0ABW0IDR2_9BACT
MKKGNNTICLRIPQALHQKMLGDLRRTHSFAYERVGFLHTTSKIIANGTVLIIATDYVPVEDDHYIEDKYVGAKISSGAIRAAMQRSLEKKGGCFHVHLHDHCGKPYPSRTDKSSLPGVVESFANIAPFQANGILILSKDSFYASVKIAGEKKYLHPKSISIVGKPMLMSFSVEKKLESKVYDRQSFLGESSQFLFENIKVGIIGYGGGGSHLGQQLAHLGVKNIIIFDDDIVEDTNLNRLVGAWFSDIKKATLKTSVAKRIIRKVIPTANIIAVNCRWQNQPELLQICDVVLGGVDTYSERQQLEAECRRYLISYIDIGMDVHQIDEEPPSISGQVILSVPGSPCMSCFGFLTDRKLALEAAKYGKVGGRPQVVWPNGVLASTAVGMFVNLVTNWAQEKDFPSYLAYNGNLGTVEEHIRLKYTDKVCLHFPLDQVGPPVFVKL